MPKPSAHQFNQQIRISDQFIIIPSWKPSKKSIEKSIDHRTIEAFTRKI